MVLIYLTRVTQVEITIADAGCTERAAILDHHAPLHMLLLVVRMSLLLLVLLLWIVHLVLDECSVSNCGLLNRHLGELSHRVIHSIFLEGKLVLNTLFRQQLMSLDLSTRVSLQWLIALIVHVTQDPLVIGIIVASLDGTHIPLIRVMRWLEL